MPVKTCMQHQLIVGMPTEGYGLWNVCTYCGVCVQAIWAFMSEAQLLGPDKARGQFLKVWLQLTLSSNASTLPQPPEVSNVLPWFQTNVLVFEKVAGSRSVQGTCACPACRQEGSLVTLTSAFP